MKAKRRRKTVSNERNKRKGRRDEERQVQGGVGTGEKKQDLYE